MTLGPSIVINAPGGYIGINAPVLVGPGGGSTEGRRRGVTLAKSTLSNSLSLASMASKSIKQIDRGGEAFLDSLLRDDVVRKSLTFS